jgi:hypothetical protein
MVAACIRRSKRRRGQGGEVEVGLVRQGGKVAAGVIVYSGVWEFTEGRQGWVGWGGGVGG